MPNLKSKIAVALALFVLASFVAPIWAVDYNPGVSAGQWVKYGNFVVSGSSFSSDLNKTDWMKIDIVAVSGVNVTLHMSGQFKNGSSTQESGAIIDIATGTMNATTGGFILIVPTNLTQGDTIPAPSLSFSVKINKTESRSYMSANRNVNIFNATTSMEGISYDYVMIWDQASGMLMEMSMSVISSIYTAKMSFNAIDTNIFATGVTGWLMDNIIYIVIAIVVIVIIIIAAAMLMKRKPTTQTSTETKESTTTSET